MPRVQISEAESSTEYFHYRMAEYRVLGRVLHVLENSNFDEIRNKILRHSQIYVVLSLKMDFLDFFLTKSA
jgi:hypothetical protein